MSTEFGKALLIGAHRAPYKDLPGQLLSEAGIHARHSFLTSNESRHLVFAYRDVDFLARLGNSLAQSLMLAFELAGIHP